MEQCLLMQNTEADLENVSMALNILFVEILHCTSVVCRSKTPHNAERKVHLQRQKRKLIRTPTDLDKRFFKHELNKEAFDILKGDLW